MTRRSVNKKAKPLLTPFQWEVLCAAMKIPLGETRSYKWVAREIGRPDAVRAVGQALKKNPYPLIIPCHRVICEDGKLGGYAGAYGKKKAKLLAMERDIVQHAKVGFLSKGGK